MEQKRIFFLVNIATLEEPRDAGGQLNSSLPAT